MAAATHRGLRPRAGGLAARVRSWRRRSIASAAGLSIVTLACARTTPAPDLPPAPPTTPAASQPAPAPNEVDPPPPPPPLPRIEHVADPSLGQFAVLREGARLRRGPSERAPWATYRDDEVVRVAVVGRQGEYLEIETASDDPGLHCQAPLSGGLALRVFVREDDLVPVLTQGIQFMSDESMVSLAPGLVITEEASGTYADGWHPKVGGAPARRWARIDLQDAPMLHEQPDLVGPVYSPAPKPTPSAEPSVPDEVRKTAMVGIRDYYVPLRTLEIFEYREGPTPTVLVGDGCVQLGGPIAPETYTEESGGTGGGAFCRQGLLTVRWWTIEADTPLQWPDGTPAGRTLHDWRTMSTPTRGRRRGMRCFEPWLGCTDAHALRFCVPGDRVSTQDPYVLPGFIGKGGGG